MEGHTQGCHLLASVRDTLAVSREGLGPGGREECPGSLSDRTEPTLWEGPLGCVAKG